jgi:hypothetical protein
MQNSVTQNQMFNTQPLLEEIDAVIKRGLSNVLKDFLHKYETIEHTHNQILNILSLNNDLNTDQCINLNFDLENDTKFSVSMNDEDADKSIYKNIHDMTQEMVTTSMSNIEKKIETLEQKYDSIFTVLNKAVAVLEELKKSKDTVVVVEKENIKLEVVEKEEEEEEEEEQEEEVEEEEEEEDEEVEEEQDEEVEEVEEEQDEEVEEEEEEEQEDEEKKQVEDEEEEELVEIEIDDVTYCTNDEENGFIYELSAEGEQGDKVGYLKDGEPFFYVDGN